MNKLTRSELIEKCQSDEFLWNFTELDQPLLFTESTKTMYVGYEIAKHTKNKLPVDCDLFEHPQWDSYPHLKYSLAHTSPNSTYAVILSQQFRIGVFSASTYFPYLIRKGFDSFADFTNELTKAFGEKKQYQHLSHAINRYRQNPAAFSSNKIDQYLGKELAKNQITPLDAIMHLLNPQKNGISLLTQPEEVAKLTPAMTWWTDSHCILLEASQYPSIKNSLLTH